MNGNKEDRIIGIGAEHWSDPLCRWMLVKAFSLQEVVFAIALGAYVLRTPLFARFDNQSTVWDDHFLFQS